MEATFVHANLKDKRVFVRADLNVTLVNGAILCAYRLKQIIPTIDRLVAMQAKIILATHLGRPSSDHNANMANLSTKQLIPWFKERKYTIAFAPTLEDALYKSQQMLPGTILLLENLRFYPGEKYSNDALEQAHMLAEQLYKLADYYINDAFGLLHRKDTSITMLPKMFNKDAKSIGLLVEKELKVLTPVRDNPKKPYVLLIGGGKVADKLPMIEKFLHKATTILIGPALSFTFMRAFRYTTGKSLVVDDLILKAQEIMLKAQESSVKLLLPVDYLVAENNFDGALFFCEATNIPENAVGVSIGPKTISLFADALRTSQTVYVNGAMGLFSRPETLTGLNVLLQTIAQLTNTSIIGGGESVTAVHQLGIQDAIAYCSTGGGATLHYLAGDTLPGLTSLI